MFGTIGQRLTQLIRTQENSPASATAVATPPAKVAEPEPKGIGVQNHGTSYQLAKQQNPWSQVKWQPSSAAAAGNAGIGGKPSFLATSMLSPTSSAATRTLNSGSTANQPNQLWTKNGSGGGTPISQKSVDAKVKSGTLESKDFKGMEPLQARTTIEAMAAGGKKQLDNLRKLMTDPTIAETLAKSMEYMKPEARRQLVHTVSDSRNSPEGANIYKTFERALNKAAPSVRNDTLREALVNGKDADHAVVNKYVSADSARVTSLVENLGSMYGAGADNKKLQKAMGGLDQNSMNTLIPGMANVPEAESQMLFRTLGEAVMSDNGKFYALRDRIGKALEASPTFGSAVLGNVARDSGDKLDPDNKGQQLAMEILEYMPPKRRAAFKTEFVRGAKDMEKLLPTQ